MKSENVKTRDVSELSGKQIVRLKKKKNGRLCATNGQVFVVSGGRYEAKRAKVITDGN